MKVQLTPSTKNSVRGNMEFRRNACMITNKDSPAVLHPRTMDAGVCFCMRLCTLSRGLLCFILRGLRPRARSQGALSLLVDLNAEELLQLARGVCELLCVGYGEVEV